MTNKTFSQTIPTPDKPHTTQALQTQVEHIIANKNATVGVAILDANGKNWVAINADKPLPLQSVFKFHIALAVLAEIDQGKFTLYQTIPVKKEDLLPDLYSPLRDEHPNGGTFTLAKLMAYAISQSDNVSCDVLLRLIGGPQVVENYLKKNHINDVAIKFNEETMQAQWDRMFQNWTTAKAASETLRKFYTNEGHLLSKRNYHFLWKAMKETQTGRDRIKAQLPEKTVVAHKTGTSGRNKEGISGAVNDIGIVFLPNGKYFMISVLVSHSKESDETNAKIIADIAKAAWDYALNVDDYK